MDKGIVINLGIELKEWKMDNRGNTRVIVYLPEEVITQILAKLPVKSLLRFRCVCKSWCSIIDSPDFVKLYGNLFDSTKLITVEIFSRMLTIRKSDSLHEIDTVLKTFESYYLKGQCDSLLLFQSDRQGLGRIRICNPSTRKSLLLPPCPLLPCESISYVLGFARQSGDYKIIAFSSERHEDLLQMHAAVYTLNDRQWVVRDNALNTDYYKCFSGGFRRYCSFEGAAHCFKNVLNSHVPNHLVSLDFDTQKVTISELPQSLLDDTDSWRCLFLVQESLAILCVSRVITKIWVLKQEEGGRRDWTLWFSGPSIRGDLISHTNTLERMNIFERMSVLYHGGDGGYIIFGKVSYSIATGQLHVLGKSLSRYFTLGPYCESLVLCNGFETENMMSHPFVFA